MINIKKECEDEVVNDFYHTPTNTNKPQAFGFRILEAYLCTVLLTFNLYKSQPLNFNFPSPILQDVDGNQHKDDPQNLYPVHEEVEEDHTQD